MAVWDVAGEGSSGTTGKKEADGDLAEGTF